MNTVHLCLGELLSIIILFCFFNLLKHPQVLLRYKAFMHDFFFKNLYHLNILYSLYAFHSKNVSYNCDYVLIAMKHTLLFFFLSNSLEQLIQTLNILICIFYKLINLCSCQLLLSAMLKFFPNLNIPL